MLKLSRIRLSGFRGILSPQEIKLRNGQKPTSLVVYGLNSTGKSSFVDGLEWFLSEKSEIEWLAREDAGCKAYPHQEAKEHDSFVEVEFINENGNIKILRKIFNPKRITIPTLTSSDDFLQIYQSFVIRPYLRYLEIIDFVFNKTGVEKYQKLANWMGFERELAFQEKIALQILPKLALYEKQLDENFNMKQENLKNLTSTSSLNENEILSLCTQTLTKYKPVFYSSMHDLNCHISEIKEIKTPSNSAVKLSNLIRLEINIAAVSISEKITTQLETVAKATDEFAQKKEVVDKIDYIALYQKAAEILENEHETSQCPLCQMPWKREDLIQHITKEIELLKDTELQQVKIKNQIKELSLQLNLENDAIKKLLEIYDELALFLPDVNFIHTAEYFNNLCAIQHNLGQNESIFELDLNSTFDSNILEKVSNERETINRVIQEEKLKANPSKDELIKNENIEKVIKISELWDDLEKENKQIEYANVELQNFLKIANELSDKIHEGITLRFKSISALIGEYFNILRNDKDIKDIELSLNLDKGKAAGRSAEIQLSYFNISVRPAFKVLSESLLNSLGLAVYFACIKQFNVHSKFIVLDDVMNSLDVGHRDTLLDLFKSEFSEYQIVLFTHDLLWFEKIQRRFPGWIHKKIKCWNYGNGPKLAHAYTTKEEIYELLRDASKAKESGSMLGVYIEGILNELCEDLQAEIRYRFTKNDPPSLEELFNALCKRLKDKLGSHPVIEKIKNAQKYEPLIRNASDHSRQNYSSSISTMEVKRALDEWIKVENEIFCNDCNRFIEYVRNRNQIECRCGNLKLTKP